MVKYKISKNELEHNLNELFLTYEEISEKYRINKNTLIYYGRQYGIVKLKMWEFLNNKHGDSIVNMYINGMSLQDIKEYYNLKSYEPVKNVLKANNIELRSRSESKKIRDIKYINSNGRMYEVNHHYFKDITNESAYWLGFIYTDGNVSKTRLTVGLQENDLNHLEKLAKSIGSDKTAYYNKSSNSYSLTINSPIVIKDLKDIGLHEDKSRSIEFPVAIPKEYMHDFIRGVIDGDGSIDMQYPTNSRGTRTKIAQVRLRIYSGSRMFIEKVNENIASTFGVGLKTINKANKSTYEITYSTNESIKIYKNLYYDGCICLDRKYADFTSYIKQRESDLSNRI